MTDQPDIVERLTHELRVWIDTGEGDCDFLKFRAEAFVSRALSTIESDVVREAYREGWLDSENSSNGFYCAGEEESWKLSKTRAALNREID